MSRQVAAKASRPATPTYLRVADRLETQIAGRAPGSPVVGEHELARRYDVSRLTARAALEELARRFLVHRSPGRGTFVATRFDYPIGPNIPPSWTQKVIAAGGKPRTQTESLALTAAPEDVCATLRLRPGSQAYRLARRRYVDDRIAAYAHTWLRPDLVPDLAEVLGETDSLHAVFEHAYKLRPYAGDTWAEFCVASAAISRKLACDDRPMVLNVHGVTLSRRGATPIETTESWLRADLFRVVFRMSAP